MVLLAIILLTILVLYLLGCYVSFRMAVLRSKPADRTKEVFASDNPLYPYQQRFIDGGAWVDEQELETLTITSFDGLKLYADLLRLEGSKKVAIVFHGYHSSYRGDFSISLPYYRELGFNLLLVDQRSHGRSEGRYLSYGILEKYDCRDWANEMVKVFGNDCEIVLSGISMGASTVMMAAGLKLPPQVKAITADCGFTCGFDIVRNTAKQINRFIPDIVIHTTNLFCRIFAGFDLREDNTQIALQKSTVPILFIHGTHDAFVPCEMTLRSYAACKSEKQLLTVAGASHGLSFLVDEPLVKKTMKEFFTKHLSK